MTILGYVSAGYCGRERVAGAESSKPWRSDSKPGLPFVQPRPLRFRATQLSSFLPAPLLLACRARNVNNSCNLFRLLLLLLIDSKAKETANDRNQTMSAMRGADAGRFARGALAPVPVFARG